MNAPNLLDISTAREITAKFSQPCVACKEAGRAGYPIRSGEKAMWVKGVGCLHFACHAEIKRAAHCKLCGHGVGTGFQDGCAPWCVNRGGDGLSPGEKKRRMQVKGE